MDLGNLFREDVPSIQLAPDIVIDLCYDWWSFA